MKKIIGVLGIVFAFMFDVNAAYACTVDEIDVLGDGTQCETAKFTVTITELADGTEFKFLMSARGTFYVDCGTDGTLSGTGASGKTITRADTTAATYMCTYTSGGAKTIRFGGLATEYALSVSPAIRFGNDDNITLTAELVGGISGSLGAIFPSLGNNNGQQPRFAKTFQNCTNLTGSIPSGLFTGVSGQPATYMFYATFFNCSGLTGSIPSGLFGNLSGAPAAGMFQVTFFGCSGLTGSIPSGLFGNLSGAPAANMFYATFNGCRGLTGSIPSGLFGSLSGAPAESMFRSTFSACTGLTGAIPSGLFGNISGAPAANMFYATFYNCGRLTGSIPSGLFGSLSGAPAANMFYATFNGCSALTGYVPVDIFENITSYNVNDESSIIGMVAGTNLYAACPCGTRAAETGWGDTSVGGRAICEVGRKSNEHWDNGICTTECALGFTHLKTSTGLDYPVLSTKTVSPSIHLGSANGVCYVPIATGSASHAINMSFNGTLYHARVPDEIVPAGFTGQPD